MATLVLVTQTVSAGGRTTPAAAAAALDTALTTAMNVVLASPPTGYVAGSIKTVDQGKAVAPNATNHFFYKQFSYLIEI